MKIYNNISNNTNVYKNSASFPNFKGKSLVIKKLPEATLKLASFVAGSVGIASLALVKNKTNKEAIIHDIEPDTNPIKQEPVITPPAQLSIFHMHDFHGQSVRMERAHSASKDFEEGKLDKDCEIIDKSLPTDRLKLCSGDMFLGANQERIAIVNEFLNEIGIVASALGNHECDATLADFAENIKTKNYRLVGTNIHPDEANPITGVVSNSFIVEINGNKYGIIGASPIDFLKHTARPEEIKKLKLDDIEKTLSEIREDIKTIRQNGANKIILLSHMGFDFDKLTAETLEDIDIILGGHTHTLFTEVKEGENLLYSPKGEPVLIVQSGRDGEYIGTPVVKFNELGQITEINYDVIKTDNYERSNEIRDRFNRILGNTEKLGTIEKVTQTPSDIYANENPNCNFMLDCLRSELNTDIAIMNSGSIRNRFSTGIITNRVLEDISPFTDKIVVIEATEKEIVDAIKQKVKETLSNTNHRPGFLQVSGLKYEIDKAGNVVSIKFINNENKEIDINVQNPSNKKYTVAVNQYCAVDPICGLGLKHRVDSAIQKFDKDIKDFITSWIKKQNKPIEIINDNRIKKV